MEKRLKYLGSRLKQYMDHKRIGTNQLGRMIGSSGALVSNILNGKNFGMSKFLAIGAACPDLNLCWLISDKDKMLLEDKAEKGEKALPYDERSANMVLKNEFLQRELELKISALESAIAYQDMTIDAYKNTLATVTASNKDLKDMLSYHVKAINNLTAEKKIA